MFGDDILAEVLREASFADINRLASKSYDNDVMGFLAEQAGFGLGRDRASRDAAVQQYRTTLDTTFFPRGRILHGAKTWGLLDDTASSTNGPKVWNGSLVVRSGGCHESST